MPSLSLKELKLSVLDDPVTAGYTHTLSGSTVVYLTHVLYCMYYFSQQSKCRYSTFLVLTITTGLNY